MKKFAVYFLIFLPGLAFGQLFPKATDFTGNIRQVVEKKYGKEVNYFRLFKGIYRPAAFSGWKYTYHFNEHSELAKRTETFRGEVKAEYVYQRETGENRNVVREIATEKTAGHEGDYLEYENFMNQQGQIKKVNYWSFNAKACTRDLFMVEQNAQYQGNKLVAFTRRLINEPGDTATASTEACKLFYNGAGKLIRIERTDLVSGFKTIIYYHYNGKGWVDHYSVDLLTELQGTGPNNQLQDTYYTYDRSGNWTRMYWKAGKKYRLEAKRRTRYQ